MKASKVILSLGLLVSALAAQADSKIVTTIDGVQHPKELTKMKFTDGTVHLTFSDNSTESADMSLVAVALSHDETTAITDIIADPAKRQGVYNLKGQYLGSTPRDLEPGLYIVNGEKVYIKK